MPKQKKELSGDEKTALEYEYAADYERLKDVFDKKVNVLRDRYRRRWPEMLFDEIESEIGE